jgi:hypothetical protein
MNMAELTLSGPPSACGETICTLYDGDFHFGLAAFLNSLVRAGYKGTVWVGYRGTLPPWVGQLKRLEAAGDEFLVTEQVRVVFLLLKTEIHLANYKPRFMLDLLANQARGCKYIWIFDPDIFVRCAWSFFAEWQRRGIALCQDALYETLPEKDPLRHQWMDIASGMGLGQPRPLNHYFNSGMTAVAATQVSFLELWQRMMEQAEKMGVDLRTFVVGGRELPFMACDQDAMNVAAMYTEHPLSPTGPEAMGFLPGRPIMYHAVGSKPWRGSMLRRALAGEVPSGAAKFFFTQVSWPIRPYSPLQLRVKRLECAAAALIGRFYRRN